MGVPEIELTGPAALGVIRAYAGQTTTPTAAALPKKVKLGRLPGKIPDDVPRFKQFFNPPSSWSPPDTIDHGAKALKSIARMYANDQYGCCVISDRAHSVGVWSANDSDSGGEVFASDAEVVREYHRICGPGDNGCVIADVLRHGMREGFTFGGKVHKIAGFVAVDHTNLDLVRAACFLFGPVCFGLAFRADWANQTRWGPTRSRVVGGHDVGSSGYHADSFDVMSWGRRYVLMNSVIADPSYCEECYAVVSEDWYGSDKLSPAGFDVDGFAKALEAIGGGNMPDPKPPTPPKPPEPPAPPRQWVLEGTWNDEGRFNGLATELKDGDQADAGKPTECEVPPDEQTIDCLHKMLAMSISSMLWPAQGCHCEVRGSTLYLNRGKLSPEQWANLLKIITQILAVIGPIIAA